jgi:periplasmic protein CpxP/Spy
MKKQLLLVVFAAAISITSVNAQGGGNFQRRTPEERLKTVHDKLDSAFHLEAAKMTEADAIFLNFYKDSDKKMDEIRSAGGAREEMMAARTKLMEERDAKLKTVLTEAQMKTWKDQIEPSMRQQRPAGGGGGGQ